MRSVLTHRAVPLQALTVSHYHVPYTSLLTFIMCAISCYRFLYVVNKDYTLGGIKHHFSMVAYLQVT